MTVNALRALKKRDESALVWFVTRYTAYVNTILSGIAGSMLTVRDLEEMTSDVFMVLWRNADRIEPGKVKAYLSGTARNIAKDRLRRSGCEYPLDEDALTADDTDLQRDLEIREQARIVKQAMENMGEPDREIFLRHYYYFQPLSQIAAAMNMNLSTVKTRLRRGRGRLKEILRKGGFDNEDI